MRYNQNILPDVKKPRSKFDLSHRVLTSFNTGDLVPLDFTEVLPGDTFNGHVSGVIRATSSFIKPVMDNAYMDIFHFFVPLRLLYNDYERVFGNPNPSAYEDNDLAEIPHFETNQTCYPGSVSDYIMYAGETETETSGTYSVDSVGKGASILPFRAFALIYDQWFRNQNTVDEMYVQKGEIAESETLNNNPWSPNNYMGRLPKVKKKADYFVACLPQPQKGQPVALPFSDSSIPVAISSSAPLQLRFPASTGGDATTRANLFSSYNTNQLNLSPLADEPVIGSGAGYYNYGLVGVGDLTNATLTNVNDLRFAFQYQKMLERDSRFGSRINEFILGAFGVSSPDARLQFTEFLGGGRIPISITQVAQTSQSTSDSPLGGVAGFSVSVGHSRYSKGFTEHGYVFTVGCVRTLHTYSQGIQKTFSRLRREDFYDPLFNNLGEQPVYRSEIYAKGEDGLKDNVFGYNEAWADYRYAPSRITGQMRTNIQNSLDIWHFGDKFANAPVLSSDFTNETSVNMDRTLSVPSESIDNFICDLSFKVSAIRVMSPYSIPGLIDHH